MTTLASTDRIVHEVMRRFGYYTMRLLWRVTIEGTEHLPAEGPAVVIANHPSYLDPVSIYLYSYRRRRVHFMAWDQLYKVRLVAYALRIYDAFPVSLDRADRSSFRAASNLLEAGEVVGIFPEGGRSKGRAFRPTKRGGVRLARRHGAPIIPCAMIGSSEVWGRDRTLPRLAGRYRIRLFPKVDPPADMSGEQAVLDNLAHVINSAL